MRRLEDIIDQMIAVTTNDDLINGLSRVKYEASYTAPEVMGIRWRQAYELLCEYFPNPLETDESISIFCIFAKLDKDELIKAVNEEQTNG